MSASSCVWIHEITRLILSLLYNLLYIKFWNFVLICRCCFRCGLDKVKFSAPQDLMCQSSVACVAIQNVCPEDKFFEMVRNNDPVFLDFLLTLCAWINIQFVISHITKGYVGYVGSWMFVFEFDLFTQRHSVEFCSIHYPKINDLRYELLIPDVLMHV